MKMVRLIKMGLDETYSKVQVGKHLSDMFPVINGLKQGHVSLPLLSIFALLFAIRRVQINQDGLKINCTNQILVHADVVNTLDRSVHTIKKNTEVLVVASKEIGLEVNADKTKHVAMFLNQNARRSHNIEIYNSSFERAEQFRYLGTTLLTYLLHGAESFLRS
jgi:hypothetical protein